MHLKFKMMFVAESKTLSWTPLTGTVLVVREGFRVLQLITVIPLSPAFNSNPLGKTSVALAPCPNGSF